MKRLHVAGGVRANELTNLLVQLPYTSMKTVRPDVKSACGSCGQLRSFTLMLPDGTCGLCACDVQAAGGRPDASCWCECRTCKRHYAVEQPDLLRVLPKCHGCRTGTELPGVACGSCRNVFVYPAASEQQQREGFTCPVCAVEVPKPQEVEVQLKRWLGLEPEVGGYRVAKVEELFRGSLWDLSREAGREVFDAVGSSAAAAVGGAAGDGAEGAGAGAAGAGAAAAAVGSLPAAQVWEGKPVLNLEEVRARVLGWVESDRSELGSCGLCFSEVPKQALLAVCGRSGCSAVGCRACLDTWYGGLKPGGSIVLAQLHCPFCKKRPAPKVQLRHNRAVCGLRLGAEALSADTHYAWCRVCNGAVAIAARECQVEAPVVAGWACGGCAEEAARRDGEAAAAVVAAYKACPGCGVRTEKTYGCDHMSCTMCGKHWCYECAQFCAEEADEVYEHMSAAHGGVGL